MKTIFTIFIGFILLSSFLPSPYKIKEKAPETKFLREVESAVVTHDADKLMLMMELDYKRSQHDEFLEGRTVQFLDEFFGSEIPFNSIESAELINYRLQKGSKTEYDVVFRLSAGAKVVDSVFNMRKNVKTNTYAIYGAVG